jgi:hypothetical protein
MSSDPISLGAGTQVRPPNRPSSTDGRHRWAHACRDGEVVCGHVELTVRTDTRLGLTAGERRRLAARFVESLHPLLQDELEELVHRRGAACCRVAERIEPIELVFEDPHRGLQRITARIQPPQTRRSELHEITFDLREPAS